MQNQPVFEQMAAALDASGDYEISRRLVRPISIGPVNPPDKIGAGLYDGAHQAARDILAKNRRALDALAEGLVAAGYLDRAEIAAVFRRSPLRAVAATPRRAVAESRRAGLAADGEGAAIRRADEAASQTSVGEPEDHVEADDPRLTFPHKATEQGRGS